MMVFRRVRGSFLLNGRCQPDVLLFKTQEITLRRDHHRLWGLSVCIYGVMFNDPPLVSVIIDTDTGDS